MYKIICQNFKPNWIVLTNLFEMYIRKMYHNIFLYQLCMTKTKNTSILLKKLISKIILNWMKFIVNFYTGSLWSSGKGKGLRCHHISSSIHLSCETKLHLLVIVHGYGLLLFGLFLYPGESLSVGCASHPEVRSVSLIDPSLTLYFVQNKKIIVNIIECKTIINAGI